MQEKFQDKGLSILAVTSEGASETEKWVASKGARYAYAYDKGGKLARYFGVSGIPHAVLVDASGTVAWKGHPGALEEGTLQKALSGALPKPLWEWSGATKGVKSALLKRAYASALQQAAKLSPEDDGPAIKSAIEALVKGRVEAMKGAYSAGDFFGAQQAASALQKELNGLPEQAEASQVLADLAANGAAAPVLKAQQRIAKIRSGKLEKKKEIEAAIADLNKIKKELSGTYAEREAQALIDQLAEQKDA
jgi:thioredoxin-like negative regulator of GroEL